MTCLCLIYPDGCHGACDVALTHLAITYHNHFFKLLAVLLQDNIDNSACAHRDGLSLIRQTRKHKGRSPFCSWCKGYGIFSVHVCDHSGGSPFHHYSSTDDRHSRLILYLACNRYPALSENCHGTYKERKHKGYTGNI